MSASSPEPTPEMVEFFERRTRAHIERVRNCLGLVADDEPKLRDELLHRGEVHDASKFGPEEYIPYIWLTEFHRQRRGGQRLIYPPGVEETIRPAIDHHLTHNRHHPEFHNSPNDMTRVDLLELVCDWTAMAQEFGDGSARPWADKTIGRRLFFHETNRKLVYDTIFYLDRRHEDLMRGV